MFYVFSYTPTASDTEADPYKLDMKLSSGVIHQVDVLFQSGANHEEFCRIFNANHQLWPTNRGEKLRGNATVVSFREFYKVTYGETLLRAEIWTTLTVNFKEIIVQIGLLPQRIIQPLSFEELLNAASGL